MHQILKRKIIKYSPLLKLTLWLGFLILFVYLGIRMLLPFYQFSQEHHITPQFVRSLIFDTDIPLKKFKNRTNIVLLGVSGGDHEGADLTDTIIFVSLDWKTFDTVMLSIPRDMWMTSLKAKINTAYHYGEKKKDAGLVLAKSAVEEIVGVPIHYSWLVDFSGFKKMIDLAGGIDINVGEKIDDKLYPITGRENDFCAGDQTFSCRFEHLVIEKGIQHMSGELALKYVRSRNSLGAEGTDFSRGKRQQQIILAFKNKILGMAVWKNPELVKNLLTSFDDATQTDMKLGEQLLFFKYFIKEASHGFRSLVLDDGNDEKKVAGYLVNPPLWKYEGSWVLIPRTGNFEEIHRYISCQLENPACPLKP